MLTINQIKAIAEERGVQFNNCGNGHVQLVGAVLVNYYPLSKKRTAYIGGTTEGKNYVQPEQAVRMALSPLKKDVAGITPGKRRSKGYKGARGSIWRKQNGKCHYCKFPMLLSGNPTDDDYMTIDHVFPLAKGGLDNANNRVGACLKCNQDKADKLPEKAK